MTAGRSGSRPVPVRHLRRTAAVLACTLTVAGCAQRAGDLPADDVVPAGDADALVLRVERVGGFLPAGADLAQLPLYSLYVDGRLVAEGPVDASYPPPALPNVQVQRLTAAEVDLLVDRARAAGVTETSDLGMPAVADAATVRIMLADGGRSYVGEAYALLELPALPGEPLPAGLTAEQVAARAELNGLLDVLAGLGGEPSVGPYRPDAVAVVARPWTDPGDRLGHPPLPWPGPPLPGDAIGGAPGVGCVVVRERVPALLGAAATADALTPWESGDGARWAVSFRPLLPDETSCPGG